MVTDGETVRPCWFDLGGVAVVPIVEIPRLLVEPTEFFPCIGSDRSAWCFQEPWFDVRARKLVYTIQSFLIVTCDMVLLVDACVGDGKPRVRPEFDQQDNGWQTRLRATGLGPQDVSTVVLTHLHVDHVGWATQFHGSWRPTFPNARHYVTEVEYDYWTSARRAATLRRTGDYVSDSVQPLKEHGLLQFCQPDAQLCPEVRLLPAFGHTPGNVCVHVSGVDAELLIVGDTLHHPVQLLHPGWSTRYCVDRQQATDTRIRILEQAAASGMPILPSHFAYPSACRVMPAGSGYAIRQLRDLARCGQFVRVR